jgi:biopolymer transport protein ExbB/TolQ
MWFEDIMVLALIASGVFLIGIPTFKFLRTITPKKRNNLVEAKERLEQARLDAEAARLNKEAEKLYEEMYDESLQDEEKKQQEKYK